MAYDEAESHGEQDDWNSERHRATRSHQSRQRRTDAVQLNVEFGQRFSRDVAESTRGMETVSDLGEKSFRDV